MTVTLSQLLTQVTYDQARKVAIQLMQSLGYTGVAAWQSGTMPRHFGVEVPAALMADMSANVANIASGGYNDTAQGDWLTLYARSAYDNAREAAVRAKGPCVLTVGPTGLTSYPIAKNQLVAVSNSGWTFRNTEAATLLKGTPLTMEFEAEVAGFLGNVPVNTIVTLQTPLVGVSINNPGDGVSWLSTFGANEEADDALRTRNTTKWATRSYAAPSDAYKNWALETDPVITRAEVLDGLLTEPGSVRIYIAGDAGELDPEIATRVEQYIEGTLEAEFGGDGIARRPMGVVVHCASAVPYEIVIEGTVYYAPEYVATVEPTVADALAALAKALPIGGTKTVGFAGLLFARLYAVVMSVPGVVNVGFTSPLADEPLGETNVAVITNNLTFVVAG